MGGRYSYRDGWVHFGQGEELPTPVQAINCSCRVYTITELANILLDLEKRVAKLEAKQHIIPRNNIKKHKKHK